ncbi:MAG: peptidoglycan DD-metalloendopeptidase family protein [Treponema sp.]|nr:peptidoglycan DD-metalloendopeptidase family protein [Treponema sp.]
MNLGYMSKPYESVTGLYNYGFRDYRPQQARFTTPDPIRDGNNWFAYVNNDPVNYVDWWGLEGWYISTPYLGSSGVSGASDKHYGNDWVYRDAAGNNITEGQRVDSETAGTVRIGNDPILGNFVRVTNDDNLRTDYFHFKSKTVTNNSTVQVGVQIGIAGNTGLSSGAHVHVAQSYPLNQVPDGIDYVNPPNIHRSYIEPPSTPPGPGNVPKAPQVYPDFDLLPVETPIKYIQNKGINMCTI